MTILSQKPPEFFVLHFGFMIVYYGILPGWVDGYWSLTFQLLWSHDGKVVGLSCTITLIYYAELIDLNSYCALASNNNNNGMVLYWMVGRVLWYMRWIVFDYVLSCIISDELDYQNIQSQVIIISVWSNLSDTHHHCVGWHRLAGTLYTRIFLLNKLYTCNTSYKD